MQALNGIRVLDLTHVFAGPFCAYQLGVMGAEVIKIEPTDTPDMTRDTGARADLNDQAMGLGFVGQGAGKSAIALNLKSDQGRAVFARLVQSADVLVQNYASGCLQDLGLLPEQLQALNPALICCSISGYGRTGPKADHPAYDVVIQAFTGMMASNGEPNAPPVRIGPPVIDYGTGAQAAIAICAALFQRERTGHAAVIDVAMSDAALMLMTANVVTTTATGEAPKPHGNQDPALPTYSAYATAQGDIMLGAFTPKQAANLMRALGNADAADQIAQMRQRDLATRADQDRAFLTTKLLTNTAQHWEDVLNAAHVPCARIRGLEEALDHPQFAARGVLQPVDVAGQPTALPVSAFNMSTGTPAPSGPPPRFGQDTDRVLAELGYSPDQIADMRNAGAVA